MRLKVSRTLIIHNQPRPAFLRLRWTPTEEQGPGSFTAAFRVTDNNPDAVNAKQLSTDSVLTITVNEVNRPPLLAPIPAATVHAGATFAVTLSATDTDIPANAFTYALVSGPAGATVSSQGQVAWTPPLAADGSVADFIVRVTEDGVPSLSDDSTFQVTVVGPVEILGTTRQGAEWTVLWREARTASLARRLCRRRSGRLLRER